MATSTPVTSTTQSPYTMWLAGIICIAAALRLLGIDFGLPHLYHTDEWFEIKRALKLGAGVYDFERAFKGGYFYLLFVEYGGYYVLQTLLGNFNDSKDLLRELFTDPTKLWLIGRVTTAIIGVINCWLVYLIGCRIKSPMTGAIAALLLAVNPIHNASSHYTTVDIPLTCLLTLAFLLMLPGPNRRTDSVANYVFLALAVAAALMNKITGIVIFASIAVFHIDNQLRHKGRFSLPALFNRPFFAFTAVFLTAYIIGNPAIIYKVGDIFSMASSFVDPDNSEAFSEVAYPQPDRQQHRSLFYLQTLFPLRYTAMALAFAIGVTTSLISDRKRQGVHIAFIVFVILYYAFLAFSTSREHIYERYLLPIVPMIALYSALGINALTDKLDEHSVAKPIAAILFIAAATAPPLIDAAHFSYRKTLPDTRTLAAQWVQNHIPGNSSIILQGEGFNFSGVLVPMKVSPQNLTAILEEKLGQQSMSAEKDTLYSTLSQVLAEHKHYDVTMTYNDHQLRDSLDARSAEYIILSEKFIRLNSLKKNESIFPNLHALVTWATSEQFQVTKTFAPSPTRQGPEIIIFKRQ